MIFWTILLVLIFFAAMSWFLWKSGFLYQAEKPHLLVDRPVQKSKEKKEFLKRLKRWKEEGKVTREEFEHIYLLCQAEWDEESKDEII